VKHVQENQDFFKKELDFLTEEYSQYCPEKMNCSDKKKGLSVCRQEGLVLKSDVTLKVYCK
jgi:hypothetical protein